MDKQVIKIGENVKQLGYTYYKNVILKTCALVHLTLMHKHLVVKPYSNFSMNNKL